MRIALCGDVHLFASLQGTSDICSYAGGNSAGPFHGLLFIRQKRN